MKNLNVNELQDINGGWAEGIRDGFIGVLVEKTIDAFNDWEPNVDPDRKYWGPHKGYTY